MEMTQLNESTAKFCVSDQTLKCLEVPEDSSDYDDSVCVLIIMT